jgi:hypothetical protein
MSEPLALRALRLPGFIFKVIAKIYMFVQLTPSLALFKLTEGVIFMEKQEPKIFRLSQLPWRLARSVFSILIAILYIVPVTTPVWLLYVWTKGFKNVPVARFVLKKVLRLPEDGRLGKYFWMEGASLNLASKLLVYFVCIMIVAVTVQKHQKKFG